LGLKTLFFGFRCTLLSLTLEGLEEDLVVFVLFGKKTENPERFVFHAKHRKLQKEK
jgi:hypothetical protein